MKNNDKILEIILNKVKKEYYEDVSLVCCYGSFVNGMENKKSDIDFYFVPKTDRAWELSTTFIVDGIGYDFWGVNWKRLEKMANFNDTFISLVDGAKIVYSHSEDDKQKFNELKQKIKKTVASPLCIEMLSKAINHIKEAEHHYFLMISNEDKKSKLLNAGIILLKISDAVCLMNNSFLRYGTKRHFEEIKALKYLPNKFADNYNIIVGKKDILNIIDACFDLILSANKLHEALHDKVFQPKEPSDYLGGHYEEISSSFNKIYQNCDDNNPSLAFVNSIFLQGTIDHILFECGIEQIDFISSYESDNLPKFKDAVMMAEEQFLSHLKKHDISIKQYASILDLENYLFSKSVSNNK